jgi:hypothetical protein
MFIYKDTKILHVQKLVKLICAEMWGFHSGEGLDVDLLDLFTM